MGAWCKYLGNGPAVSDDAVRSLTTGSGPRQAEELAEVRKCFVAARLNSTEFAARANGFVYDRSMPARALSSGTITFGLVSIPVKLYTAASAEGFSFNMLHKKCSGRMKQQYVCPTCNETVERGDMTKGYEHAKNQYVIFSDEELKALESPKSNTMEITEFVPATSIDLAYLNKTYWLGPDKGGDKAYKLLAESMIRSGKVAIGKYYARGREELVMIRPFKEGLALHYVYHATEMRDFSEVDTGATVTLKDVERDMADKLIEQLSAAEFHPENYKDEYVSRVAGAVEQKVAGQQLTTAPEQPAAQIIDLFEALKRSLETTKATNDAKAAPEVPAAPPPAPAEKAIAEKKPIAKASPKERASKKKAAGES